MLQVLEPAQPNPTEPQQNQIISSSNPIGEKA